MFRVVVCVLALLMAGCAQEVELPQEETCEDESCMAVVEEKTSDVGAIRGVTVDETITPVANATVKLLNGPNGEVKVKSGANGAFAFEGIPPGFYFVSGALKGFEESQTQVEVVAGEVARTKILLSREPVAPMFAPTIQFDGLLGCSWYVQGVVWLQLCSILGGVVGDPFSDNSYRVFTEDFDELGVPDHVQFELYWESTQALGGGLTMMVYSEQSTLRSIGPSPLIRAVDTDAVKARNWGNGGGAAVQIWSGVDGYPVGMTFQQDFQLFVTPFFGFLPEEGWSFITDGQAEPPGS